MKTLDLKKKYGYSVSSFLDLFEKNPSFPKGSFQIKKRGESYYWYYTLSKAKSNRVKYLCKAKGKESFQSALEILSKKFNNQNASVNNNIPPGPLADKWSNYRSSIPLVSPANKKKMNIVVIGTGLAGASASASLGELGYNVKAFCFQDSARRAHSIAAQGGINAAKNYQNDGDSVYRLFYDTIKGGDYRSREANVYRLAEVSANIIDQCVAQGVPFAREYGGLLDNRSFGGVQVSRTFYARGQTGQQLLLGAYSALSRQVKKGSVQLFTRHEMQDVVLVDGEARGVIVKDLVNGQYQRFAADAVVLATGGYGNVYYLSTNAMGSNVTASWRAFKKGAYFANPSFCQIHPTCIPVSGDHQSKLTLMSESLRNDGRIWVPKKKGDTRTPIDIPEEERNYYLERRYPAFGNLVPRDVASRAAKEVCDDGYGVGNSGLAVYLDFKDAIQKLGKETVTAKYGNLFAMYEKITGEDPYKTPMRIYPAIHYTMGGTWVDYNLMTTIPGLYAIGECNFSDHGANRLGASALMQGLADGYFILPYTIGNYLSKQISTEKISTQMEEFNEAEAQSTSKMQSIFDVQGNQTVESIHKKLGKIIWDYCGMSRSEAGLISALGYVDELKKEFWKTVKIPGEFQSFNTELDKAGRLIDFIELGDLMIRDALNRRESCGGHFRIESQTETGEAKRIDSEYSYVSAWEHQQESEPRLHKEKLEFENVKMAKRSYK
ncbi:MAG: succinate dehydrogenase flavoprotein subunit [Candidatus Marinimicrobia bacterium]|nr:succinate dehydrogenase flavoprotein subunit [Candidatus Neomarinimicrobiota bacterium]